VRFRAIASDVDGTLLRSDGTISPRTEAALAAAEDAGIVVVLCTGRPPDAMTEITHRGIAVCGNGTVVHDLHTDTTIKAFGLDLAAAAEIGDQLVAAIPELELGHEIVGDVVTRMTVKHPTMSARDLERAAHDALPDLATRATTSHWPEGRLMEIFTHGLSKATALEHVLADHGIAPAEVIAFGDYDNDLPLLAWAGHAVAMGNAVPEVKAIADEVTLTNDEDGLAVVVERLLA
jgi:HAD superfamily hydrolase (TIGR01484 family)